MAGKEKINRQMQDALIVTHPEFKDGDNLIELYANARWFKLDKEGPADLFFQIGAVAERAQEQPWEEQQQPVPDAAKRDNPVGTRELNLSELRGVVNIDDDNEPLQDNIPDANDQGVVYSDWGHGGVCWRKQDNNINSNARLPNWNSNGGIITPTIQQLFELFFPMEWLKSILLEETNKQLTEQVSYGEFLRWIGLSFLMSTTQFGDRRKFWSTSPQNVFSGAPF